MCNCNKEITIEKICSESTLEVDCTCAIKDLSTDCILFTGDKLECSKIEKNLPLTEVITALDEYICTAISQINSSINLVNIGEGFELYAGVNLLGKRKIKTLKSTNSSVTITNAGEYLDLSVPAVIIPDGSETKINPGTNITITGNGTAATPYVVNTPNQVTPDGSETKINPGTNITITGQGTTAAPYVINAANQTIPDGSETKIIVGPGLSITGAGTVASPYNVKQENLQKILTLANFTANNYTITEGDNNYVIIIQNNTTPVTITIPTGLSKAHFVGYTQEGTADITFVSSGTTLKTALGLKIKGENFQAATEQNGTTNVYHVHGNTKL